MKEITILWHSFQMDADTYNFLQKYLKKIHQYADKHNISSDVIDDIEQNILEKLMEHKWKISQKDVVSIVNSIWEPEDIFSDSITEELNIENKNQTKEEIWIDKVSPIFLWVCSRLWRWNKIAIRVLRTFFLFWTCFFNLLVISLSRAYILTEIPWLVFLFYLFLFALKCFSTKNAFNDISPRIKRIANRIHKFTLRLCGTCIWSIIKFCFWGFLAFCLLFAIWCAIWGLVCYYWNLFIEYSIYQYFIENFPIRTVRVVLACLLFRFITFIKSFTKNPLKNRVAHYIALWAFVVASIFAMASWLFLLRFRDDTFINVETINEQPTKDEVININMLNEKSLYVYYRLHTSDEFWLEWRYDIRSKSQKLWQDISEKVKLPTVNQNSKFDYEIIRTWDDSDLMFEWWYLQDITLDIFVPQWYKIKLNRQLERCDKWNEILAVWYRNFKCLWEYKEWENWVITELRSPEVEANTILQTIKNKDLINFASYISDEYWVEFFPYWRKANFEWFILDNWELFNYLASSALRKEYIRWKYEKGVWDITMNIEDYFDTFVYDVDFLKSNDILVVDWDDVSKDSELYRLSKKYKNCVFVNYQYENKNLILFMVPENLERKLVAVVHE